MLQNVTTSGAQNIAGDKPYGLVVIGRNEGKRLKLCLQSAPPNTPAVYVDSGSTDNSLTYAQQAGATIVKLDMTLPFTAARARNTGLKALQEEWPALSFVQFVDGDCELQPNWIAKATTFLLENKDIAVVCGRRRERFPERSIYNKLCDIEWDTPPGEAKACGGDALMRIDALKRIDGFNPTMIAGEEPELCLRLRNNGWRIWRLDEEMTLHDAAIERFSQWWARSVRAGYAFALGAWMHGRSSERYWVRETIRSLFWGAALPAFILLLTLMFGPKPLLLFLIYLVQVGSVSLRSNFPPKLAWRYGLLMTIGKFAETWGVLKFAFRSISQTKEEIIEYK